MGGKKRPGAGSCFAVWDLLLMLSKHERQWARGLVDPSPRQAKEIPTDALSSPQASSLEVGSLWGCRGLLLALPCYQRDPGSSLLL